MSPTWLQFDGASLWAGQNSDCQRRERRGGTRLASPLVPALPNQRYGRSRKLAPQDRAKQQSLVRHKVVPG